MKLKMINLWARGQSLGFAQNQPKEFEMWKSIAIGAAALAVVGVTYLSAQPAPDQRGLQRRLAFSRDDANAFLEARIAALHAGLQLTPEQERLWPAFDKAYRDRTKERIERRSAARAAGQQQSNDPIARLQRRAASLTQRGAALKTLADAEAPLWQSLDDSQKRRFAILQRTARAVARDERARLDGFRGRDGDRLAYRGGRDRFGDGRDGDRFGFGPRDYGRGQFRGPRDPDGR
jgi:hypothetical protein